MPLLGRSWSKGDGGSTAGGRYFEEIPSNTPLPPIYNIAHAMLKGWIETFLLS